MGSSIRRPGRAGAGRGLRVALVALLMAVVPAAGALVAAPAGADTVLGGPVSSFGDATLYGAPVASQLAAPVTGMAATPDGKGYWLVGADGGVFSFGDAAFYGSAGNSGFRVPFVGIASTPDGKGYWIADVHGGVSNFGDAQNEGYIGAFPAAPVVGIAAMPTAMGYWLVGADGGVFSQGAAQFYGSMGGTPMNAPVVGIVSTPDGKGYWLVGADGGVFSFGDAQFSGSLGATPPNGTTPVVAMASTPDGGGYWLATSDRALPSPTPVPSVLDQCTLPTAGPSVEPRSIVLACGDGNASLTHLTWSSWTATTATATGEYTHNLCVPNCAQGTFVSVPSSVRLGYPVETSAGQEFAMLSYTYADPAAPSGFSTSAGVAPTSPG